MDFDSWHPGAANWKLRLRGLEARGWPAAMAADRCTVGIVSDTRAFLAAATAKGIAPKALGQFKGLNLGTGKMIDLTVYRIPQD